MPATAEPVTSRYTIAVRELCEFAAKTGDLDTRFTPSPTSDEGQAGHRIVAARRASTHRAEVSLSASWRDLVVRGRADGFDAALGVLEEVKTCKGAPDRLPANRRALHWAQAKIYAALVCQQMALPALTVRVVYFDIDTQQETVLEEARSAAELQAFFEDLCGRFLAWARCQLAHRETRDAALGRLVFPHAGFRSGQRVLAESSFRAARAGRCLLAQAGTGIGKTLATVFPALKAMATEGIDKVFFLTAKTSGQAAPLDALAQLGLSSPALPLRVLQLVARDKACDRPGRACHGESCDLARGFYDRLAAAREDVVRHGDFGVEAVQHAAARHGLCRYYLAQELARWADVVVADYNYQFDGSALLAALTAANDWRVALLVDEAHNLVERARAMYSVRLSRPELRAALAEAPAPAAKALRKLLRVWSQVVNAPPEPYAATNRIPETLLTALRDSCAVIDEHLAAHPAAPAEGALLDAFFAMRGFLQLAESFDTHSFFEIERPSTAASSLGIRNVVPAPFLKRRFQLARASVLFSATLTPTRYYTDLLGLPDDTAVLDVEPPFSASQLEVRIARHVSTRFGARERSLAPIADLMAAQFAREPGNYLAFFSSFDYLERACDTFIERHPEVPVWRQDRTMNEARRAEFLQRFHADGAGIGFAVLGGSFGEGIDLPGRRLIGAFVATLGLPQFNAVNEQMRSCMDALFETGYDYAYLYPGLRKVVQAAGRVIRTPDDRGFLCLIDDRFARAEVRELLPRWWQLGSAA